MLLKKNIIIFGPSRSGKTTLSIKLAKELDYNIIMLDSLVTAFEKAYPYLGICHANRDGTAVKNIEQFLYAYIKSTGNIDKKCLGINYIYEGSYFNLESLLNKYDDMIIIFLCCPMKSVDDYYKTIKKYDKKYDWTFNLNEVELYSYCEHLKKSNDYFLDLYNKFNIKYFDTSQNRDKVLREIVNYVKNLL